MPEKILEIEELSYVYRGNWLQRRRALERVSLEVYEGESFGFIGHNGAGKTTTIKCILNLVHPSTGAIRLFGASNLHPSSRKGVGYLPEQPYFYDHLSVDELMNFYARLAGLRGGDVASRIDEALDLVKVAHRRKSRMRSLSKGLVQRVGMAQAIIAKPRLLILDEPFSGLDPIGRREFRELLISLRMQGTAIFMSSHILSDVEFLCDRVAMLVNGVLKGTLDLRERDALGGGQYEIVIREFESIRAVVEKLAEETSIEESARGRSMRLRINSKERADEALRAITSSAANLESFEFLHPTLEELFVKVVESERVQKE